MTNVSGVASKQKEELFGHRDRIKSLAFSPSGSLLASASWDFTVRLWDGRDGTPLWSQDGHKCPVDIVKFSPDCKRVFSGSGTPGATKLPLLPNVRAWDVNSGRELYCLTRHCNSITNIIMSGDIMYTIAYLQDSAFVWDISTGRFLGETLDYPFQKRDEWATGQYNVRGIGALETQWISSKNDIVAYFPVSFEPLITSPIAQIWAGARERDLFLVKLEGTENF